MLLEKGERTMLLHTWEHDFKEMQIHHMKVVCEFIYSSAISCSKLLLTLSVV